MGKVANRGSLFTVVLAMVAAAALLALADMRPAEAAFPGLNGRIAYDRPGGDIWTMDPNGSDQRNLMPGPNDPSDDPAWSPDDTKIAFARTVSDSNDEIFTMNADGTGVRRLTNNATLDGSPAWSPDGTRIVFARFRAGATPADGHWDVWVMDSDGSRQTRLTSTTDRDLLPVWSPDGRKITFVRNNSLYVMNPDGTDQRRLSSTGGIGTMPNWSPDGTELVFTRSYWDDIVVIDADGTGERRLTADTAHDYLPAFSPNGRYIVYSRCPVDESTQEVVSCGIRKMRSDGTFQMDLTSPPAGETHLFADWQPLPAFRLDANAITIPFRDIVLISGRFVYGGPAVISGRQLTLWEQPAGSFKEFTPVPGAETTTDEDGFFSFEKVQPQANTNYQVRFAGDLGAGLEPAMSPIKPVNVRVLVSLDLSTGKVNLGNSLTMSGEVQPSHGGEVTLTIKRDGEKVATKRVGIDEDSRYSLTYEPRRSGSYSVVARFPGDDDHVGNTSPRRSISVVR
jgi:dipeptidyl aminopeptidase/acylaminoacyl peptidase